MTDDVATTNVIEIDFKGPTTGPAIFWWFWRQGLRRRADLRRQRRKGFTLRCGDPLGRARLRVVK